MKIRVLILKMSLDFSPPPVMSSSKDIQEKGDNIINKLIVFLVSLTKMKWNFYRKYLMYSNKVSSYYYYYYYCFYCMKPLYYFITNISSKYSTSSL